MSSLTGNLISSTYQSLLKIATNNTASANLVNITDGAGNATALSISTTTGSIAGDLIVTGTIHGTATTALTASYIATASSAVSASNANFLDGLDSTAFMVKSGSNIVTSSIILNGQLSFDNGDSALVLPATTAPIPTVGSTYFDENTSTLYIYDGSQYIPIQGSTPIDTAAFATTGSNTFIGNQTVTGSIIPGGLAYDLGSLQNPWKEIYVSTGSVNFIQNGSVISTLNATADSFNVSSNITVGNGGFEIGRGKGVNVDTSVILGAQTMTLATGTAYSIGIGYQTMNKLVNGISNIAIGQSAGANLVNGNYNVLVGNLAGRYLSEQIFGIIPEDNTYVGSGAGANHTTGSQNTAIGAYALYGNVATQTTNKLNNNTAIGRSAGSHIDGVSANNIYIGAAAGPTTYTQESYKFYVGNGDVGAQPFMYGSMTGSRSLDINGTLTVSSSLVLPPAGAPSTPASGTIYFSSADTHFYGWNGAIWKQLDN